MIDDSFHHNYDIQQQSNKFIYKIHKIQFYPQLSQYLKQIHKLNKILLYINSILQTQIIIIKFFSKLICINTSSSVRVGASAAATFLEYFVEKKVRWIHWDIANVAVSDKNEGIYNKGETGFGVMSLIYYMTWDIVSKERNEQKQENDEDDN